MMNSEAEAFFNTLPKWLREEILQSGVQCDTRNELEQIARNFAMGAENKKDQTE